MAFGYTEWTTAEHSSQGKKMLNGINIQIETVRVVCFQSRLLFCCSWKRIDRGQTHVYRRVPKEIDRRVSDHARASKWTGNRDTKCVLKNGRTRNVYIPTIFETDPLSWKVESAVQDSVKKCFVLRDISPQVFRKINDWPTNKNGRKNDEGRIDEDCQPRFEIDRPLSPDLRSVCVCAFVFVFGRSIKLTQSLSGIVFLVYLFSLP